MVNKPVVIVACCSMSGIRNVRNQDWLHQIKRVKARQRKKEDERESMEKQRKVLLLQLHRANQYAMPIADAVLIELPDSKRMTGVPLPACAPSLLGLYATRGRGGHLPCERPARGGSCPCVPGPCVLHGETPSFHQCAHRVDMCVHALLPRTVRLYIRYCLLSFNFSKPRLFRRQVHDCSCSCPSCDSGYTVQCRGLINNLAYA